jgi:hypothetical protein
MCELEQGMQKLARYLGDCLSVEVWLHSAEATILFTELASSTLRITLVGEKTWD